VVPVSDLSAVALRARDLLPSARALLIANDARMREVYWGRFSTASLLAAEGGEHVGPPSAVPLPELHGQPWAAAGRGLRAWPDLAARCREAGATLFEDLLPRASELLELARPLVAARQVLDPSEALPVYVRDRVAEPALS
jgi:tRNA threonylcarbamoyladenosine biosynthesis protein TsaB